MAKKHKPLKKDKESLKAITIRLNNLTNEKLEHLAITYDFSKAGIIRTAIEYLHAKITKTKIHKELADAISMLKNNDNFYFDDE